MKKIANYLTMMFALMIGTSLFVYGEAQIRGSQIVNHTVTALQLDTPGVTAGAYGDAAHYPTFTVAADGRLTLAGVQSNVIGTGIAASVFNSTNQTLTVGTEATIAFDSTDYDASGLHSNVTNNSRMTIPAGSGGVYKFTARTKFTSAFNGAVHLRLYKNGSLITENTEVGADLSVNSEYNQVSADISVVATDYVEFKVLVENAAGTGTINTVSGTGNTQFQASSVVSGTSPLPSPALVLLEEHTASSSASIDFTTRNVTGQSGNTFQSDFDEYKIEYVGLVPATNNVGIGLRVHTGGSFISTGTYAWTHWVYGPAGTGQTSNTAQTEMRVLGFINASNTNTFGVNGEILVFNPLSTALHKVFEGKVAFWDTGPGLVTDMFSDAYSATTAIDGFQSIATTGNIASGTVRCYGVAK